MQSILQPEYFVPIHGEYRMLFTHARLAEAVGLPKGHAFVMTDGEVLVIDDEEAYLDGRVSARYIYIDGKGIGDFDEALLRERADLSTDGVLVVLVTIEAESGVVSDKIEVFSHGLVDSSSQESLHDQVAEITERLLDEKLVKADYQKLSVQIRDAIGKFLYDDIRRRPTVMPLIINI